MSLIRLREDKKTGILYRPETFDEWILKESRGYFSIGIKDYDTILDLGGHVGCFAARAMLENKKAVCLSIEAEESNYKVLRENAKKFDFECEYGAIVEDSFNGSAIDLYVNELKNNALHSIVPVRGRNVQVVKGIGFRRIMCDWLPTIIKCDIEGGEYQLPWECLAEHNQVRMVIMELHLTHKGHREEGKRMIDRMQKTGFTIMRYPLIGEQNWTAMARWER